MVAHVAFWEETFPTTLAEQTGKAVPTLDWPWYQPGAAWPGIDEHNAREAAWARDRSVLEVIWRWDAAQQRVIETIEALTDDEASGRELVGKVGAETFAHEPEHLAELSRG